MTYLPDTYVIAAVAGFFFAALLWLLLFLILPPPKPRDDEQPPELAIAVPKPPPVEPRPYQTQDYNLEPITGDMRRNKITIHLVARPLPDIEVASYRLNHLRSPIEGVVSRWALRFKESADMFTEDSFVELEERLRADVLFGFEVAQLSVVKMAPDWELRQIEKRFFDKADDLARKQRQLVEGQTALRNVLERLDDRIGEVRNAEYRFVENRDLIIEATSNWATKLMTRAASTSTAIPENPPSSVASGPGLDPRAERLLKHLAVDEPILQAVKEFKAANPNLSEITKRRLGALEQDILNGDKGA